MTFVMTGHNDRFVMIGPHDFLMRMTGHNDRFVTTGHKYSFCNDGSQ